MGGRRDGRVADLGYVLDLEVGPIAAEGLELESSSYRSYEALEAGARKAGQPWWTFSPTGMFEADDADTLPLDFEAGPTPRGDATQIASMMSLLVAHTSAGGRAAFIAPAAGAVKRMVERFAEAGAPAPSDAPPAAATGSTRWP